METAGRIINDVKVLADAPVRRARKVIRLFVAEVNEARGGEGRAEAPGVGWVEVEGGNQRRAGRGADIKGEQSDTADIPPGPPVGQAEESLRAGAGS